MRTLVISDLHLGLGRRRAVLESPAARARLGEALTGVGQLVLLGDTVELTARPRATALAAAEPVLREVGRRLAREAEVIVVPGNHDRPLLGRWLSRQVERLELDTLVPHDASPELARLVSWLGAGRVRVRYPGVWLQGEVWATHGHYLNRHLVPESAYGWLRGRLGRPAGDRSAPGEYERRPGGGRGERGRAAPAPLRRLSPRRLLGPFIDPRFAPVIAPLLSLQMQHASLPAMARVSARLGVEANHVLFGHVHRLGPRAGDALSEWAGMRGGPSLLNTGSWVYEPTLLDHTSPPHPYWPGGAVLLEPGRAPRAINLLDGLDANTLRGRSRESARRLR